MKLISVSSHGIGAWLIKLFTFSKWNHTAVYFEDTGEVYDSTLATGVRKMHIDSFMQMFTNNEVNNVRIESNAKAKAFAEAQLGKKYDITAILGILTQRDWQDSDKWFCSELAEAVCVAGGNQRFRDEVSRITPHQSWSVK